MTKVTAYEDKKGRLHKTEMDALQRDIEDLLSEPNEGGIWITSGSIIKKRAALIQMLTYFDREEGEPS